MDGPQEIGTRHANLRSEFLDSRRADHFCERHLKWNALFDSRQEKALSELLIPKIPRQS